MTAALLLALLVVVPAPAQADPINEENSKTVSLPTAVFCSSKVTYGVKFCRSGPGETDDCQDHNGCSWECYNDPNGAECKRQQQCEAYPGGPLCDGERRICEDGTSTDWDTDGDTKCDKDDLDDDGDGVPDQCDPTNDTNPVDSVYNRASYILFGC